MKTGLTEIIVFLSRQLLHESIAASYMYDDVIIMISDNGLVSFSCTQGAS